MGFSSVSPPYATAEPLASGESTYPRVLSINTQNLVSGQLIFGCWTAATSGLATAILTCSAQTAAVGLTYAGVGIYSVDAQGDLTLITSTPNLSGSLWSATYTGYNSPLTSPFPRIAGQRYATGLLVAGTTPPAIYGLAPQAVFSSVAPIVSGCSSSTGLSTLPASLPAGSQSTYPNWVPNAIVAP
jgi:hypothetical protein